MPAAIGLSLGLLVGVFAKLSGFDRDRSFYPTVVIVVGAYYVLFAAMAAPAALAAEVVGLTAFAAIAVASVRTTLWVAAVGLAGHGIFDMVHADLVANPGVPGWWPSFCAACDVALAACLALRLWFPHSIAPGGARDISPTA